MLFYFILTPRDYSLRLGYGFTAVSTKGLKYLSQAVHCSCAISKISAETSRLPMSVLCQSTKRFTQVICISGQRHKKFYVNFNETSVCPSSVSWTHKFKSSFSAEIWFLSQIPSISATLWLASIFLKRCQNCSSGESSFEHGLKYVLPFSYRL